MNPTRLAAAGAAAALLALGMAGPAHAAAAPKISVSPNPFKPGATLDLTISACETQPTGGPGQIFRTAPVFSGDEGGPWTASAATKRNLKPGKEYTAVFTCDVGTTTHKMTLRVTAGGETEEQPPTFSFGLDDVKLSTNKVVPGGKTTFTVTCPTEVTITSNAYTVDPLEVTKSGENTWTATGTFKASLPDPAIARVTCKGHGTVTLRTSPDDDEMKPGKPVGKIPVGRIDTGDGSTQTGSGLPLVAGGSAAALAVAGLGAFALRRRIGRERS